MTTCRVGRHFRRGSRCATASVLAAARSQLNSNGIVAIRVPNNLLAFSYRIGYSPSTMVRLLGEAGRTASPDASPSWRFGAGLRLRRGSRRSRALWTTVVDTDLVGVNVL
jgi:hypothetical protein